MKKKLLIVLLAVVSAFACAFGITGCDNKPDGTGSGGTQTGENGGSTQEQTHSHSFTMPVKKAEYLKSAATCTENAVYYYSCSCGEKGTNTFKSGAPKGHVFTVQAADKKYLKSEASCLAKAAYYVSCSVCGEADTDTFEYGEPNGHSFNGEICEICGAAVPTAGLEYTLNSDGTAYIVSGIGTATTTDIIIADIYNGKLVTSIGNSAFNECSGLTSITIPDGVTEIGESAFNECSGLTSITIPDGVTVIGESAFSGCRGLTSVTIPDSVTIIRWYAFSNCSGLTNIEIPSGVTNIGDTSFDGCSEIKSITVNEGNVMYKSEDNCLLTKDGDKLVLGCKNSVIPSSVKYIGYSSFSGCSGLTSITIPDSVTSIGSFSFYGCSELTSITIPSRVTSIGDRAFYGCRKLTSVTIPDSVTRIGHWAFYGCDGIIQTENGVQYVDQWIVECNTSVSQVTLRSDTKGIGEWAFHKCNKLTSITIPDGVTSIGYGAFENCYRLIEVYNKSSLNINAGSTDNGCIGYYAKNVYTTEDGSKLTTDKDGFVIYDGNTLVKYVGTTTEITIPDGITIVNRYAFSGCRFLPSIIIPDRVTNIGYYAFTDCDKLTIYCEAESKPEGWDSYWNSSDRPVVWGYKPNGQ